MLTEDVLLISMPWPYADRPSIQLGTLHALLAGAGIRVGSRSYYVSSLERFVVWTKDAADPVERIAIADYEEIAQNHWLVGLGEWVFAVSPYRDPTPAEDEEYFELLRRKGTAPELITKARVLRSLVPRLLEELCEEVVAARPRVVGFTSTFSQNVASLALAKMIKERAPSVSIIFGGSNCDGPMGEALLRTCPWVDVAVRGEAERVLVPLVRELLAGEAVTPRPGVSYRDPEGVVIAAPPVEAESVEMDSVPTPVYDEYFERLAASPLSAALRPSVKLLYESARGCWWGAKSHCTFCGLNGSSMAFRAKSPDRVEEELLWLTDRYKCLDYEVVDNIISMDYLTTLLPRVRALRQTGVDLTLFYETKANLRKDQLRLMREAGVYRLQPGIESLSTPILKLMKKGVSALQNIRLLKWASELGINIVWNLIYGFPNEPQQAEYDRMADVVKSLVHLDPPGAVPSLLLQRFSPYHSRAAERDGYELLGPMEHHRFIYDADPATMLDLVYDFEYRYTDGRSPHDYAANLVNEVSRWRAYWEAPVKPRGTLRYRLGPGFMIISDRRPGLKAFDYHLDRTQAEIYLACDAGATVPAVVRHLRQKGLTSCTAAHVEQFLRELLGARLVYEEGGSYLSLAVPTVSAREEVAEESGALRGLVTTPRRELPVYTAPAAH